jgi:hypothetical protein
MYVGRAVAVVVGHKHATQRMRLFVVCYNSCLEWDNTSARKLCVAASVRSAPVAVWSKVACPSCCGQQGSMIDCSTFQTRPEDAPHQHRFQRLHNQTCCCRCSACRKGWLDGVKLLLAAGVDVDLANKRGLSALGEAVAGGHVGIAEALLRAGADPNWRSAGCVQQNLCPHQSYGGR